MKSKATMAAMAVSVIALAVGGIYVANLGQNDEPALELSGGYAIPLGSLSTGPASEEVTFEKQAAAIEAFRTGDRSKSDRYLSELKNVVRDGKGAFFLMAFVTEFPLFGFSREERDAFMASLPELSTQDLRAVKMGWQNLVKLRTAPLAFSAPTLQGGSFDLSSLRGKVVLIDHWDTGCSSCVEAMPKIESAYQKYRRRGFEVVSIVYNDTSGKLDLKAVQRIERETGTTWPNKLNGAAQWEKMAATFGYAGRPQYMLLDRDGRLVAETGEIKISRNLEALLERHL